MLSSGLSTRTLESRMRQCVSDFSRIMYFDDNDNILVNVNMSEKLGLNYILCTHGYLNYTEQYCVK